MKPSIEEVLMEFTDEAKQLIVLNIVRANVGFTEFRNPKYKQLMREIHFFTEALDKTIEQLFIAIAAINKYGWSQDDVINKVERGTLFDDFFEAIKNSGDLDKILATAEVVNVSYDPKTDVTTRHTLH